MRLVTWNAGRGRFATKAPLLEAFDADISIIQEIAPPPEPAPGTLWFGANGQGVAIIARDPYRITAHPVKDQAPSYVVPISVEGPTGPFVLFAVWTLNSRPMQYIRSLATAVDLYADVFRSGHTIVVGDFNSNAIWDRDHPKHLNHSSVVARLSSHGLTSAYHHIHGEEHGKESHKTFHLYRHEDKGFHIDYCFLPTAWTSRLSRAEVGPYDLWSKHSDHRPLLVEVIPTRLSAEVLS
jgi:exodeoxyribonuclease III